MEAIIFVAAFCALVWAIILYVIFDPFGWIELRFHKRHCENLKCRECYPWLDKRL